MQPITLTFSNSTLRVFPNAHGRHLISLTDVVNATGLKHKYTGPITKIGRLNAIPIYYADLHTAKHSGFRVWLNKIGNVTLPEAARLMRRAEKCDGKIGVLHFNNGEFVITTAPDPEARAKELGYEFLCKTA